ncbi:MAG: replication endonuclease [Bacteroidales bacterium]|nr:replication endonuclease [Bacteroidales bacterium]
MFQGSYLFGNRVVTPKMTYGFSKKSARGSSSFVFDGVDIGRKPSTTNLQVLEENLYNVNTRYRGLLLEVKKVNLLGCDDMEKYLSLCHSLKMCEYDRDSLKSEINYILRYRKNNQKTSEKTANGYTLNKTKVRDKCTAFFELERSRKFCAFYSVSFPAGSKEEDIYKVWNSWLTNLRKTYGLRDYLWVAEYQQNGTLHYHLLVNVFMNIKRVNRAMGIALFHQGMLGDLTIDKYNGVDVKRVTSNRGALNAYLTKYISKSENHTYKRAPWRCSQSVSALFTSVAIDAETSLMLQREFARLPLRKYENDFADIYFFNVRTSSGWFNLPDTCRKKINELNNRISRDFEISYLENNINRLSAELSQIKRKSTRRKKELIMYKLKRKYEEIYCDCI